MTSPQVSTKAAKINPFTFSIPVFFSPYPPRGHGSLPACACGRLKSRREAGESRGATFVLALLLQGAVQGLPGAVGAAPASPFGRRRGVTFDLSTAELARLGAKRPRVRVEVYAGGWGVADGCWARSGKLVKKVAVEVDPAAAAARPAVFHN